MCLLFSLFYVRKFYLFEQRAKKCVCKLIIWKRLSRATGRRLCGFVGHCKRDNMVDGEQIWDQSNSRSSPLHTRRHLEIQSSSSSSRLLHIFHRDESHVFVSCLQNNYSRLRAQSSAFASSLVSQLKANFTAIDDESINDRSRWFAAHRAKAMGRKTCMGGWDAFERKFAQLKELTSLLIRQKQKGFFKSFLAGNSLLPFGIFLLFQLFSFFCMKFHRLSPTGEIHEKRKKKREKRMKKHSAPFSHEIESLSGMWGHVWIDVLVCTMMELLVFLLFLEARRSHVRQFVEVLL